MEVDFIGEFTSLLSPPVLDEGAVSPEPVLAGQFRAMEITVILCTYNRFQLLGKALESIAASVLPDSLEWEVMVVDNNSSDQTAQTVETFAKRYPRRFRYVLEPQPGKSYALNSGIRKARGEILVFTDDDVTVDPDWLQNLTAPLRNGECAGAGGRILLQFPSSLPRWLALGTPDERLPFPSRNFGAEAKEIAEPLFGANMAFRKDVFEKYGLFRTDLGPSPDRNTPASNDDTEFSSRLIAAKERVRYEPSAVVYHPVAESRLQRHYFLTWSFDKGRADIRAFGVRPGTMWYVGSIPLYLLRKLAVMLLRWIVALGPSHRFSCKLKAWSIAGMIQECYRQSLSHAVNK